MTIKKFVTGLLCFASNTIIISYAIVIYIPYLIGCLILYFIPILPPLPFNVWFDLVNKVWMQQVNELLI